MSYIIDGPVDLGDTTTTTNIHGNIFLVDAGDVAGNIYYAASSPAGQLTALPIGTIGNVLTSNGTLPVWSPPSAASTIGFSVAKTTGSTFNGTALIIPNWNITSPASTTVNPYFNTGILTLATGLVIPTVSGKYILSAYVEFNQTLSSNAGTRSLIFAQNNNGSITAGTTILSTDNIQPTSQSGASINQYLQISGIVNLSGSLPGLNSYCLQIVTNSSSSTQNITTNTHWSLCFLSA